MHRPDAPPPDEASGATRLVFALHFHQPYGNLDQVFADATDRCYEPTLDLLHDHPHVITTVHVSGPLIEWLEQHRTAVLDKLAGLVERGQVEILGGGWQEPMLAILPDRDAVGQLATMAERCEQLFGQRPRGMWLAERVWEPDLPRVIAEAGYRYTLLDDTHLHAAGERELGSYYVTEKAGRSVCVFPIDRGLRTRIPFADVEQVMGFLRDGRGRTLTYGDDTEKFGLWPTTEQRVWRERWLERFFGALRRDADLVATVHPAQVLAEERASGPVYIPTISYREMGEWTLPADAAVEQHELSSRLELAGFGPEAERFVRGGIWQGFLGKYPESRLIHRKMLRVSEAVERARERGDARYPAARDALYRGQCNCAYWHGLFGGLYLQHLRSALMSALIEAETLVEPRDGVTLTVTDHDGDLVDDVLIEAPDVNLYLAPARGGSVFELDLRPQRFHLTGVLGRRPEAYHRDVARARVVSDEELGNVSAHDLVRATEPGLVAKLRYDAYPRGAFVDHLLPADATIESLDGAYTPLTPLPTTRYDVAQIEHLGDAVAIGLRAETERYQLDKRVRVGGSPALDVSFQLEGAAEVEAAEVCFATEFDFTLLTPAAEAGRRIEVLSADDEPSDPAPGARGVHREVREVRLVAEPLGIDVTLTPKPACELWRLPIETVSQSERGFEPSYQGTALVFVWRGKAGGGAALPAKITVDTGRG
jgi:alpha-amylase